MPRLKRSEAEQQLAGAAGPDFLEALARGLRVIEAFGRDRRWLTLSDVARLVDLPRASVRRTLTTLVKLGYAETDDRLFRLTPRILTLAGAYLSSNAISDIVQPALEVLSDDVNEACSAAVLDGDEVVMIAHASPNRMLPGQRADRLSFAGAVEFARPHPAGGAGRPTVGSIPRSRRAAEANRRRPLSIKPNCAAPSSRRAPTVSRWSIRRPKPASDRSRCR